MRPERRKRAAVSLVLAALVSTLAWTSRAHGLCGDLNTDGHVAATDALVSLQVVVAGGYRLRGDVNPESTGDGAMTVTDSLRTLQSAVSLTIPRCAASAGSLLVATSSVSFGNGGLTEVRLDDFEIERQQEGITAGDSVLRMHNGRAFVLNRFAANNLQEIDLDDPDFAALSQCSLGSGANPHDVVLITEEKGYVTRYDKPGLGVVDLSVDSTCGGFVSKLIDLSALSDSDGVPEMDQMALIDGSLFVALQRLDRRNFFLPTGPGTLAVIDTVSDTLIGEVPLQIVNPFAETKGLIFEPSLRRLFVGGPGTLFTNLEDGGIEAVNPQSASSEGIIITGAELGGDLLDFVIVGSKRAYAIVSDRRFVASLVEVDLTTRSVVDTLIQSEYSISDIELDESGILCAADRNPLAPGLRCFDIASNLELTEGPVFGGLTPFNVIFRR
jgi:hypothetical protein